MSFPNNIRQLRQQEPALTQAELGRLIGMEHQTISAYERGEKPLKSFVLQRLAAVLNCQLDDIIGHGDLVVSDALSATPPRAAALASALAPGVQQPAWYRVASHAMDLAGYLPGDFVLATQFDLVPRARADFVVTKGTAILIRRALPAGAAPSLWSPVTSQPDRYHPIPLDNATPTARILARISNPHTARYPG